MSFTEAQLEQTYAQLLEQEGYRHVLGNTLQRAPDEVLIEADLRDFLMHRYASDGITSGEVDAVIRQLKSLPASDLYQSNALRGFSPEKGRPE